MQRMWGPGERGHHDPLSQFLLVSHCFDFFGTGEHFLLGLLFCSIPLDFFLNKLSLCSVWIYSGSTQIKGLLQMDSTGQVHSMSPAISFVSCAVFLGISARFRNRDSVSWLTPKHEGKPFREYIC